jgi:hypothetical protein
LIGGFTSKDSLRGGRGISSENSGGAGKLLLMLSINKKVKDVPGWQQLRDKHVDCGYGMMQWEQWQPSWAGSAQASLG